MFGADGAAAGRAGTSAVSPALDANGFPEPLAASGGQRGTTG
ncbi:hypothetical protein I546_0639 [Mycobacterium kansasii 732]|nr:hypothetical protein I546_0639 [Mycobacterium kansasii 732]